MADQLAAVIGALVGVVGAIVGAFTSLYLTRRRERSEGGRSIEQRINRLTSALSESAHTIEVVEAEIKERSDLVEKLRRDAETYEQLKNMNREEAEAVAQALRGELETQGRRSFWSNAAMNFVFFVLGVGTTVALSIIFGL
jgi:flagellar biosynthesis/type III secretory pathway M-ring protein FliF/YscJ